MSWIKVLFFSITIASISCQQLNFLFDLDGMYEQGSLEGFLSQVKADSEGVPVTLEECMDKPIFKITKMNVTPKEVIKGQNIKIKVGGVMLSEQIVNRLDLKTFFNDGLIYEDKVDKKDVQVKKGAYAYDYEASVPGFTPSGKWEIFVKLINKAEEEISCVKASFTMP